MLKKIAPILWGNRKKRLITSAVVVVIIAAAAWTTYQKMQGSTAQTTESLSTAARSDLKVDVTGDGAAEISTVNVDFDNSGELKELYVKEGDRIKKGQVLAKLDDSELKNKLMIAKANYEKSLANLKDARSNNELNLVSEKQQLDSQRINLEQTKAEYEAMLKAERAYSKQDIDNKARSLENAQNSYAAQSKRYATLQKTLRDYSTENANIESAKVDYEIAQNDLDKTIMRSPGDGTVLNIGYNIGEIVSAAGGSNSDVTADTTHFMVITGSDKVSVKVSVSETDLANISVGQKAEVEFEAFAGETFTGKVVSIKALPTIDQNNLVSYEVKIDLSGAPTKIKSGMTCSVSFIIKERNNVITIPNKAVTFDNGKQTVTVRKQDGSNETRQIKTGFTDGKNVEVTSGLKEGESVVTVTTVTTTVQAGDSNAVQ